jgi:hypothetical protein
MAAGQGFKTFATGDVLTAADTNGYLMQGVWVFANAAARTAAVTSPQEGNMSFLKDTNSTEYYSGSAWVAVAGGASGYTKIQTSTFSAVSDTGTTFDGVFTSAYRNYVVLIACSVSTNDYLAWRLRYGGTTMTTGYFGATRFDVFTGGVTEQNSNNGANCRIAQMGSYKGYTTVNVSGVGNTSERGFIYGDGFSTASSAATTFGYQADSLQTYDGFILSGVTGTVTGTVTVYGLAN